MRVPHGSGAWAGLAGFGFGGLFDAVLVHQLLGWHRVVPGGVTAGGIPVEGQFQVLMAGLMLTGLVGTWRRRTKAGRRPGHWPGTALIGFGLWHLTDALLFHALLGLHRVRPDADQPLLWDLGWALVFGLLPVLLGWRAHGPARNS